MKSRVIILICCVFAMMLLTGCLGGGGDSSGSSSSYSSDSGDKSGDLPHNPEPATIALLGSGLVAYAFLRKKNKK